MTELKTLSLAHLGQMSQEKEFYERLVENRSITNLILLRGQITDKKIIRFFEKIPNIHSVTVPGWCDSGTFRVMAQTWNELESLSTDSVYSNTFDGVLFPNLKTLRIQRLLGKISWNEFTARHGQLTDLTVEDVRHQSYLNNDDIDQITTNVRLQNLSCGGNFVADDRFFVIVWEKCPYLKTFIK